MTDPIVEIEGLTFRYRRATEPALRDLSLTVLPGEVLLVAGPSGCGKSTLIRAINGLIPHAYPGELGGEVRVGGKATSEQRLREIALHVGTLLQDPARQIVGATVEAEMAFGPENLGMDRAEIWRRIRDVSVTAGIERLLGRETANLSGGERQLLAMAGILMLQPRLFVVDEPLANLDPITAARLLTTLRAMADQGHAVVIVEHRVEEALELRPDRVLYLDEGRTAYLGNVEGFLEVADPAAVKLPFPIVLDRYRRAAAGSAMGLDAPAIPDRAQPADESTAIPRLDFRGVHAGYGEREVLHDVTASLGNREVVAVLGPNGSGKTTLLRTAMGLTPVTAGDVLVNGQSIRSRTVADLATTFGFVFQSPSQMLFARTVREELTFGPQNLKRAPDSFDAIVDDALHRTSLDTIEDIRERPPLTLSFGQQKRLAIAIAVALQPPTLILDEPSAGQDHRTAEGFMHEVLAIPGLESIYLVTHDVDLALAHASRILLFRDGQIVADGPPGTVIEAEDRWTSCNLRRTSLIRANTQWRAPEQAFLGTDALARWIISREGEIGGDGRKGGTNLGAG
ncbi:MAG TPA: ABC transporter ATP-binding protein [Candidatus Limnocylindrales bacterium]|jgi:energy-coupling factor transport system ATP-binding protein